MMEPALNFIYHKMTPPSPLFAKTRKGGDVQRNDGCFAMTSPSLSAIWRIKRAGAS